MSNTSSPLPAKRCQSPLQVNVDNMTLQRLLNNDKAMRTLAQIETFRNLGSDIETELDLTARATRLYGPPYRLPPRIADSGGAQAYCP